MMKKYSLKYPYHSHAQTAIKEIITKGVGATPVVSWVTGLERFYTAGYFILNPHLYSKISAQL